MQFSRLHWCWWFSEKNGASLGVVLNFAICFAADEHTGPGEPSRGEARAVGGALTSWADGEAMPAADGATRIVARVNGNNSLFNFIIFTSVHCIINYVRSLFFDLHF